MYVYEVFKNLKLVEDSVESVDDWVHPTTGLKLEKAVYLDGSAVARRGYRTHEFVGSAIYSYDLRLEYSLALGCQGRDWHDVLAKMIGYDRTKPEVYPDDSAFVELLDPYYSGATFGPSVSRKLLEDFDNWQERASKVMEAVSIRSEPTDLFAAPPAPELVYDDAFTLAFWWLRNCFAHAAENGIVRLYKKPG
ncbi:hypothetical protein SAMN05216345_10339 [Cupriavidus sp. YR651]|uniref:hypothetical protein n=1 Tax=Cupriavidus sp. YR651 TaxID=1855315 RepID=UPI000889FD93|nr:hypothetical protein [Cupriavidus sp. YR651]SDC62243.1 hypothetical protein SAMN05216345_10339 [Cupriavidus sp. YR651]